MRFGTHEATVSLVPVAYQYPALAGRGEQAWDANWLVVTGEVRAEDGGTWSFTEPCLTTWEAARLGTWLQEVVYGGAEPVPADCPLDDDRALTFTEPTLAFSVASRSSAGVVLRVHLSLDAPAARTGGENTSIGPVEDVVAVAVSGADLTAAVSSWEHELTAFPVR